MIWTKYVYFRGHKIYLPDGDINSKKIKKDTPQYSFIVKHKSDIQKEMGALLSIFEKIDINVNVVLDAMAGCGFSSTLIKEKWPECNLILNDKSDVCYDILKYNFAGETVTNMDVSQLDIDPCVDLVLLDFNNFTMKRLLEGIGILDKINEVIKIAVDVIGYFGFSSSLIKNRWPNCEFILNNNERVEEMERSVMLNLNSLNLKKFLETVNILNIFFKSGVKRLMFADSASYAFKFNRLNEAYGIENNNDYFKKLNDLIYEFWGWSITYVSIFGNASLVLCRPGKNKDISFLDFKPVEFELCKGGGFIF